MMTTKTNQYCSTLLLRHMVLVLVAAIVAALGISVAASGEAHAAGAKIVTKNFHSPAIHIPEWGKATPYPSEATVSGFKRGRIRDVNLYLHGFSHTYPDEVDVMLVGPTGKQATVMSDVGGSFSVNGAHLALDDEITIPLPNTSALTSGDIFRKPANYGAIPDAFPSPAPTSSGNSALSVFDGSRPNGTWKLFVVDDASSDGGQIAMGWTLKVNARVGG